MRSRLGVATSVRRQGFKSVDVMSVDVGAASAGRSTPRAHSRWTSRQVDSAPMNGPPSAPRHVIRLVTCRIHRIPYSTSATIAKRPSSGCGTGERKPLILGVRSMMTDCGRCGRKKEPCLDKAQLCCSSITLTASNVLPPCVRVMTGEPSDVGASRTFIWGISAERTPFEEGVKRMGS